MLDVVARQAVPNQASHGEIVVRPGGSTVVAARAAAALDARVCVIGRVGADAAGKMIASALRDDGIDAVFAVDPDASTGCFVAAGKTIVADRGASAGFRPADVPSPLKADAVLVSGYALLQSGTQEAGRAAIVRARSSWIAVGAGSAGLVHAGGPTRFDALARGANAVFVNEEEAVALTGEGGAEAADSLAQRYRLACVTRGRDGATAVLDGERVAAHPSTRVEHALPGAGDAFAAVVLISLVRGQDLQDALAAACEAGARVAGNGS